MTSESEVRNRKVSNRESLNEDEKTADENEQNVQNSSEQEQIVEIQYKKNNRLVNWITVLVILAVLGYYEYNEFTDNEKVIVPMKRYFNEDRDKMQFLAKVDEDIEGIRFREVNCTARGYHKEEEWGAAPEKCGTLFTDTLVTADEAQKLRTLVKKMIDKLGYQSEEFEESRNIRRIRVYEGFVWGFKNGIFTEADYDLINKTSVRAKSMISKTFGLPEDKLFFSPICEMTRFRPITEFREFRHIDKVRSPPLIVTSIIWLSTVGKDFEGGETEFLTGGPEPFTPLIIEPKLGRFGAWTSGYENPHAVLELESGERYALLFGFTTDSEIGYLTIDHVRDWYMKGAK